VVRFIKVKELEQRRQELVARSEIHRRMLHIELANVRFSAAIWKQRFAPFRVVRTVLRFAGPLAGVFLGRRRAASNGAQARRGVGGVVSTIASGIRFAAEILPLFRKNRAEPASEAVPPESEQD
jgi:hypothetical protein